MTITRRLARPLLAAAFVDSGVQTVRSASEKTSALRPLVDKVREPLHLTQDLDTLVRATGAAMAGSGVLFGLGRFPRASALVMAASMVPVTYADNAFWAAEDPTERKALRSGFIKNVSLVGAALVSVVDTDGRPGLSWRGRRAARDASRAAARTRREARRAAHGAGREARLVAHRAGEKVGL